MSDMVERAAVQIYNRDYENSTWQPFATYDGPEKRVAIDKARAALLAALDPEDEALQIAVCRGIGFVKNDAYSAYAMAQARSALLQLKALAQGESVP